MADETTTVYGRRFARPDLPAAYDAVLVPRVFDPWALRLLELVQPKPGEAAVDVACGPGTVARRLAERVGGAGRVTGADASEPMLEIARQKPVSRATARIEYVHSPAAPLALPDAAFDLVTCQHGLMFFPDRVAALSEMRRVLKPGGRVAIAIWAGGGGPIPIDVLRRYITDLGVEGAAAPRVGDQGPTLAELLSDAGFADVRVERQTMEVVWGDAEAVVAALPASALHEVLMSLTPAQRERGYDLLREDLARHVKDGQLVQVLSADLALALKPA